MDIFFYLFASIMVISALGVISSKNPVYSVLWLVFTFLNSSAIFIMLGAEFIAMSIIIVYVGAVAVLFLFVVMMLKVEIEKVKKQFLAHKILGTIISIMFVSDIIILINAIFKKGYVVTNSYPQTQQGLSNSHALGQIIYTDYIVSFQLCGIILLVAMIGAIVLTLRKRDGVKTQSVSVQVSRTKEDSITMLNVPFREGVSGIKYK